MYKASRNCSPAALRCTWALLLMAGSASAADASWEFDVWVDSRHVGTHRFSRTADAGGAIRIDSDARFDVRILGVPVYRYRHRAQEHWVNGCLQSIRTQTEDNGRSLQVVGALREGAFRLDSPAPVSALPECVASYAYWQPDTLLAQRRLLNPQTGQMDEVKVVALGRELLAGPQSIMAHRYQLQAARFAIDIWYSDQGEWLQLETSTGSRRVRYRLSDRG